jgi:actin-related protein 3
MAILSRMNSFREDAGEHPLSSNDVQVTVKKNIFKTHSVWLGGSILASSEDFFDKCYTRAQFEEEGPRIFRQNVAFKAKL